MRSVFLLNADTDYRIHAEMAKSFCRDRLTNSFNSRASQGGTCMTDPELAKLFEEAVKNGITSSSWMIIMFTILSGFVGAWCGGYLKKKSEHYATKEDFDELLKQVKDTTSATEAIKLEAGKALASFTEQRRAIFATELETTKATL
jgi:hypothetical protein